MLLMLFGIINRSIHLVVGDGMSDLKSGYVPCAGILSNLPMGAYQVGYTGMKTRIQ